jgi:hypothetical protein
MGGYPLGYPDIRQDFRGKGASAPSGGYPPGDSGYPQQIPFDHLYKRVSLADISSVRDVM